MADAVMDAGCDRRDWNHDTGVPDRMCCQPMDRLGSLGLQQSSGEYFGADLSAVYDTVAAGQPGRNRHGRLDPVPEVRGGTAALQTDLTDKHTI